MLVARFASVTHNDQQKILILESTNTRVIPSREDGEGPYTLADHTRSVCVTLCSSVRSFSRACGIRMTMCGVRAKIPSRSSVAFPPTALLRAITHLHQPRPPIHPRCAAFSPASLEHRYPLPKKSCDCAC